MFRKVRSLKGEEPMSNDMFGLIYTGEASPRMRELTTSRSIAAVPFGGRYRVIDFLLSNMVNTGITNVGIITQRNYHSLMDHLGSGKEWDLHRKRDGLFILPPFLTKDNSGVYRGTVDAIRSVLGYIRRSPQKYVLLTGSHTLYNTCYEEMLKQHILTNADITIMCNYEPINHDAEPFDELRLSIDESDGSVQDMYLNYRHCTEKYRGCDAYLMGKTLLESLVEQAASHGEYDFMRDILIKNADSLKMFAWKYNGYVARLDSIEDFYAHNMAILEDNVRADLFNGETPIYTKVKDEVPAKYIRSGCAKHSVVADGCIIEGKVENSVLFRGVHVAENAVVRNSVVMQGCYIGNGSNVSCVIMDKGCNVNDGRNISGFSTYPLVVRKGTTL